MHTKNPTPFFELIRVRSSFAELSRTRRLQLATLSAVGALACAAAWGAAAGSCFPALAVSNLVKVPLIVLLSAVAAAPLGIVAWKLLGDDTRASDLLLAHARGLLAGAAILGALVPIVAIYYHSSAVAGPLLAVGTALVALVFGGMMFVRFMAQARGEVPGAWRVAVPVGMLVLQAAAMLQLVVLVPPILPDKTIFRKGIDGLTQKITEVQP
jgi:hypothetical protein